MRVFVSLFLLAILTTGVANAQMPEKFTNLQYFPKDISKDELMNTMRGFSFSLGVRCDYCHAGKDGGKMDFPSDEKEPKKTARAMLKMVADINQNYIGKLGKTAPLHVECVTCHHALARPQPINAVLADTLENKDTASAVAQYRELRDKYYGTARYDFGETPLNVLTESLLKQKKTKDAAAMMEMNVEFNNPPSMWTYHLLSMAHTANGDTDKAKADLQKTIAQYPDDKWAKQQLQDMAAKTNGQ
jgi:Photosynthetic reaction centre cytochrome C subunit